MARGQFAEQIAVQIIHLRANETAILNPSRQTRRFEPPQRSLPYQDRE